VSLRASGTPREVIGTPLGTVSISCLPLCHRPMITCEDDPTHRRFTDLNQGHRGLNADSNEPADESQTYNRRMQARPEVTIVDRLESMKGRFGSQAARQVEALLDEAATAQVTGSGAIGRLHEVLLFMRAYPASSGVLRKTDRLLRAFARRIEDPDAYAGGEISGIAGTRISAIFSHEVARRLAARHRRRLALYWEDYEAPVHLPPLLLRKLSLLGEDWPVEANIPFEQWFDQRGLDWLLNELDADTYDALRIALTWSFGSAAATRSHARWPAARVYYHDAPLLRRSDVSLAEQLAGAPLPAPEAVEAVAAANPRLREKRRGERDRRAAVLESRGCVCDRPDHSPARQPPRSPSPVHSIGRQPHISSNQYEMNSMFWEGVPKTLLIFGFENEQSQRSTGD